ncbi:isoaspartyl peptidase/L-asparaginase [Phormidium tenue FACHB-886]|nr:isoaspartyl peptidase/L-asparaginase [Phormidium tenue FACHB-886]
MAEAVQPKVIIHGGAGLSSKGSLEVVRQSLYRIVEEVYALLQSDEGAEAAVAFGCRLLEDEPMFNAGTGSVLQSDGQIRMSASLMNGNHQRFSGVINVARVKNPIDLAVFLQGASDRILSDHGAVELARELGLPLYDPAIRTRLLEWVEERENHFQRAMAGVTAKDAAEVTAEAGRGTIGVVARDSRGQLAVGTSTGGKGFERIGRVSDSAMPAGNYASSAAAVSCTGIGEHIVDECFAARVVVRVTDGMPLETAFEKSFYEAAQRDRDFGAIGISADGTIAWGKTSEVLISACHTGEGIRDTLETELGVQTGIF